MKKLLILILCFYSHFSTANQLKTIDTEKYFQENPSIERKAILEFAINQFENRRTSQEELDRYWNNLNLRKELKLMRFQIIDQKLYAESFDMTKLYFVTLTLYFQKLIQEYKISDLDMLIHAGDEIEHSSKDKEVENLNSFMLSKDINSLLEKNKFLLPDSHMVSKNWAPLVKRIKSANDDYSWQNKEEKVFWRGNASGGPKGTYQLTNFSKIARLKLVFLSKLYPDIIDAHLTGGIDKNYSQSSKDLDKIINLTFGGDYSNVKEEEHLKYKYLISVDGNTCAWMRVPWIMLSNSVLLKQETTKIEWFYYALKPYHNYVPVKKNLIDLFEKYQWLKQHDDEAKEISSNATKFVENNLLPEDIDKQMVIILNEYAKIQNKQKIIPNLIPAEDNFSINRIVKNSFHKILGWFQ